MTTNVATYGFDKCKQKRFSGRTVLITGAAGDSQYAAAKLFSAEGARVMLCDLSTTEPKLKQQSAELLSESSAGVIYACGDVSNVDDVKKWVHQCVDELGGIDVLFNGAITVPVGPLQLTDESVFKKSQDYDVYGTFLMMKYVSNKMIESGKGGVILNMSGYAGLRGVDVLFPYCASRFAVNGMTRAAAKGLAKHKIRVCAIATNMIEGSATEEGLDGLADLSKCSPVYLAI